MEKSSKYINDYESYPSIQVHFHKSVRRHLANQKFVVPWQMEENKKEKDDAK